MRARRSGVVAVALPLHTPWLMPNVVLYMLGVLIVAGALAYGASMMGVEQTWIGIGVAVIAGLGLMGAVAKTRAKESPD